MKHILSRDDSELIKKVYVAQEINPTRGDFVKLVQKDLEDIGLTFKEAMDSKMTRNQLKTNVKCAAFKQLLELQKGHKKVKHIKYDKLKLQAYLKSPIITQKQRNILTLLRSQCLRGIKMNFTKMYRNSLYCPLNCNENPIEDSQEHILKCLKLSEGSNLPESDIFSEEIASQGEIAQVFLKLMKKRETLLEPPDSDTSLPGASILDPSSQHQLGAVVH